MDFIEYSYATKYLLLEFYQARTKCMIPEVKAVCGP